MIDKLKKELIYLDARIKFILDIIENKLKINNRKKSEIEEYLEKNDYPKKNESENVKENYDYLIKMPIWNLTYEKKEELLNELNNKKDLLAIIEKTTIEKMWLSDLEVFEKEYQKYVLNRLSELDETPKKKRSRVNQK